jgi:hypothetical protein
MRPPQGSPILAHDLCAVCTIAVAQRQPTLAQPFKAGLLYVYYVYVYVYFAAVDLCGRLHLPVPYSPMSDANGDREEEAVPSLSTSTAQ